MINTFKVIVSCVILNDQNQVLLGQRSENEDIFPGFWGIPGGKIEVEVTGKNTIEEALVREAREEMGIEIQVNNYLESSCRVEDNAAKLYIIFSATIISGTPAPLQDTSNVIWFSLDSIPQDKLTPHTYENILQAMNK